MDSYELYNKAPWPTIIFQTRYSGIYEGGFWAAINGWSIPPDARGSDVECAGWWMKWGVDPAVAVGATPGDALFKLITQDPQELLHPDAWVDTEDF